ncbi:uncharacterized protein [Euwallacea fornicatus]|uniref:uncharacterized protein n=1 Tax=Euwallacea fornicatus TaxID=995702 RepID=UPI00338D3622
MSYNYSNHKLVDMLIYRRWHQNAFSASRLYAESFPGRHHPAARRFVYFVGRARETKNLTAMHGGYAGRHRPPRMTHFEEHVLDIVQDNPTIGIRRIAEQVSTSHMAVWKILNENQLYPYHV